ncbi:MAG TPA: DUF3857 domain-containing protein [Phycisphaerae bacterium]|nr:DUF3857 domain-containing protein [Phycisphaerae bacterium]
MNHLISAMLVGLASVGGPTSEDDLTARIAAAGNASKYESAACVVVYDDSLVEVQPNGLSTTERRYVIKILTDKGIREQAVQTFDFDPVTNRFQVKRVRIHRAEGGVEDVELGGLITAPAPVTWGIFWGSMFQTTSLPRLEINDCLEIVTSKTGFNLAYLNPTAPGPIVGAEHLEPPMPGHWHDTVYFQGDYPIIEQRYRVRVPTDKPLQFEVCHGQLESSVRFDGDHSVYTFIGRDIELLKREPRMEAFSDAACKLVLATVPDWIAKSKWFHDANVNQFEVTPEIQAKVNELIAGIDDDTEKIRRINCWVADNVRYVGNSRGVCEGYTMHKGSETFRDRGGVCKDKAGMGVTMLRAAGFDTYPVMTQAGSAVEYTPADQFNHAVVVVRNAEGSLRLVDPTWSPKSREIWSSREPEQYVVYGLPEGHELGQSPYFPPEHNAVKCKGTSRIEPDGRLTCRLHLDLTGYPDTYFRRGLTRVRKPDQRGLIEGWLARLGGLVSLDELSHSGPIDYSRDVAIDATASDEAGTVGNGTIRMVRLPLLQHPFADIFAPDVLQKVDKNEERKFGMRMRATRLLSYSDTLTLPAGWTVEDMPEERSIDNDAAGLKFTIKQEGQNLHYTYEVTVKKQMIPAELYEGYREVNEALHELADAWVVCRMDGAGASEPVAEAGGESKEVTR